MRIFLIITGVLVALFGVACGASGVAGYRLVDGDGYVTGEGGLSTPTAAFVIDTAEFRAFKEDEAGNRGGGLRLRVRAERADGGEIRIGIGARRDIEAFTEAGSFQTVRELDFDPFRYNQVNLGGPRPLGLPSSQLFRASVSGEGRQELIWPIQDGEWRLVIMNADGAAGLDIRAEFGMRFPYLRGFAIAAMVIGTLSVLLGVFLVAFQFRPGRAKDEPELEAE